MFSQGQLHLVRKHLAAQVGNGFVGNPLAGDIRHVFGNTFGQKRQHQRHRHPPLGLGIFGDQVLVYQRLEQAR